MLEQHPFFAGQNVSFYCLVFWNTTFYIAAFPGVCSSLPHVYLVPALAAELYHKEGVIGLVGPGCTYALDPVARLAAYWNIPIVTGKSIYL